MFSNYAGKNPANCPASNTERNKKPYKPTLIHSITIGSQEIIIQVKKINLV